MRVTLWITTVIHLDTPNPRLDLSTNVGTEGNELADRMAMLGAQSKEKALRLYQETMDVPTLLKMRAG
jgi:hypothetical protein